ncbi:MAG: hypothetical protein Q8K99_11075 [Actinomycetota bacterium]|nr:hypothetical protein [Actinomycetota bacterium]
MSGIRTTQKSRMARILRTLLAAVIVTALLAALTGCGGGSTPSSTATKPPAEGSSATGSSPESAEAASAATQEEAAIMMGVTPIDEAEAGRLVKEGARLINVDTKATSNAERIKGAKQVPLSKLVDAAADWSTSKAVIVTSGTQARSMVGAAYLARQGFAEVYYLFDGHDGWTGSYAGSSPRKPTDPPLCYYIYRSDYPDEDAETIMRELEDQFDALEDKYDQIDFELIDGSVSLSKALSLLKEYKIKQAVLPDGSVDYVIPQWILVDSNGKVTTWNAYINGPLEVVVPTIHGFVYKTSEKLDSE